MEDPWVNAWGEPHKPTFSQPSTSTATTSAPTWTPSSKFVTDDQADIGMPSWDTDSGAIWDESVDVSTEIWTKGNRISQLWETPSFDSITFAKPSPDPSLHFQTDVPSLTPTEGLPEAEPSSETHVTAEAVDETAAFTQPQSPDSKEGFKELITSSPASPATGCTQKTDDGEYHSAEGTPDPDGFGGFAAAPDDVPQLDPQLDPWTPSQPELPGITANEDWNANWGRTEEPTHEDEGPIDEWEAAKRRKELQDRYVPPELLDNILRQLDEFTKAYWPNDESESKATPYQHDRRDLAEVLDMQRVVTRLVPSDLTLPPAIPFAKTTTSKEMTETLKLTKHSAINRYSPFAMYMNSRGSLSWEMAVKSKPDISEPDVTPVGWRIIPKENVEQQSSTSPVQRSSGGFLSFFGKKTASSQTPGIASPVRTTTSSNRSSTASPRASIDVKPVDSPAKQPEATSSMPSRVSVSSPTSSPTPRPESPIGMNQNPSAISRFFGRFRSNRSSTGSARNSIALTSDDLEFLSDIVPSASNDVDEPPHFDALTNMINTPPLPTKLPPPLAPPPRVPTLPKPLSPPPSSKPINPIPHRQSPVPKPPFAKESLNSSLLDLDAEFSSPQSQASSQPIHVDQPFAIPAPLPPPLAPSTSNSSRSQTPPAPVSQAQPSAFDDDEFSEFQMSPMPNLVAAPPSFDSAFASFMHDSKPTPRENDALFDAFVSSPPPPNVPEKFSSKLTNTPRALPPSNNVAKVTPPPLKRSNIQSRRNPRSMDHQRTLSLLENAATRGCWPAPPSPLPQAIPPPLNSQGMKANPQSNGDLFDLFEESLPLSMQTGSGQSMGSSSLAPLQPSIWNSLNKTSVGSGINIVTSPSTDASTSRSTTPAPARMSPHYTLPLSSPKHINNEVPTISQSWAGTPPKASSSRPLSSASSSLTPSQPPTLKPPPTPFSSLSAPALTQKIQDNKNIGIGGSITSSTAGNSGLSDQDLTFFDNLL